jgi:hypothetical protein
MSSLTASLLNIILVMTTVLILVYTNSYVLADAILQIILYEINARRNCQHRNSPRTEELDRTTTPGASKDPGRQHCLGFVACVIAYREDSILFERCLRSYVDSGGNGKCRPFVLGIDGNEDADMAMFVILQKVVWDSIDLRVIEVLWLTVNRFLGGRARGLSNLMSRGECEASFIFWDVELESRIQ